MCKILKIFFLSGVPLDSAYICEGCFGCEIDCTPNCYCQRDLMVEFRYVTENYDTYLPRDQDPMLTQRFTGMTTYLELNP